MGELLRPDVAGDSVTIRPGDAVATAPPLWLYASVFFVFVACAALMDSRAWSVVLAHPVLWFMLAFLVIPLGYWELSAIRCRAASVQILQHKPDPQADPLVELATRCWALAHRERTSIRVPKLFDAATWIETTGAAGPRLVLINCELRPFEIPQDVSEEVDMAAGRKTSASERRHMWLMLGTAIFMVAAQWPNALVQSPIFNKIAGACVAGFYGLYAFIALGRLGFRPVTLSAAVASPGRLEVSRFGRDTVFTRADSVLVVSGTFRSVRASFVRADGRSFSISLVVSDDEGPHLALVDLLSRWCCREGSVVEQTSSGAGQDRETRPGGDADGRTAEA